MSQHCGSQGAQTSGPGVSVHRVLGHLGAGHTAAMAELTCDEGLQHGWLVSGTCLVGLLGGWPCPPHDRCAAGWALVPPGNGVWCLQALAAWRAPSRTCAGEWTPAGGIADSSL